MVESFSLDEVLLNRSRILAIERVNEDGSATDKQTNQQANVHEASCGNDIGQEDDEDDDGDVIYQHHFFIDFMMKML